MKRGKEEKEMQRQQEMLDSLNKYYEKAKNQENIRHQETITRLENMHASRMAKIRNQESEYIKKLTEINMKYSRQKERLIKKHDQQIKMYTEPCRHIDMNDGNELDDELLESIAYELRRLIQRKKREYYSPTQRLAKLQTISTQMDSIIQLTRPL